MATITPNRARSLAEDNQRVRGPLDRLRGYIRTYVSLEGLALALLFLAVCFWVGFLFDYGFFWLFRIDWIDYLPGWFRLSVLLVAATVLAILVASVVVWRLLREFTDVALALVLEKRFPQQLGDRLITAVELSDPDKAAEFGYSRVMVRETIREAAERVDQLPLDQVFDWKRLRRSGLVLLGFTVVAYLLAIAVGGTVAYARDGKCVLCGYYRFNDLATIWFERNVVLLHRTWPRNAFMEVITPEVQELRVGRDAPAPSLRVRAYRYLLADYSLPENWRPLTWKDLQKRPELLQGGKTGTEPTPPPLDWKPRDEEHGLTVDEIALHLKELNVRKRDGDKRAGGYSIADDREETGWRPLLWSDLTRENLGGLPVPYLSLQWETRAGPAAGIVGLFSGVPGLGLLHGTTLLSGGAQGLSVNEIVSRLPVVQEQGIDTKEALADVKAILDRLERIDRLQTMLDQLNQRAALPGMYRTLRKLAIPERVLLSYAGASTTITKNLQPSAENSATGNEFTGDFTDLKPETYRYWARGSDYTTPERKIIVLPPPTLVELWSEEERPAYLYYRLPAGSDPVELRGKKQVFEPVDIASVGSDVSRREVPAGTNVTLRAKANTPLDPKSVSIKPFRPGDHVPIQSLHAEDDQITMVFENVRQDVNFVVTFKDADGVAGSRNIHLKAKDDQPPELIEVKPGVQTKEGNLLEVIRKTKDGYLVTHQARIPFMGQVRDDNGLARVRYAFSYARSETGPSINAQALALFAATHALGTQGGNVFLAAACWQQAQKEGFKAVESAPSQNPVAYRDLPAFEAAVRERVEDQKRGANAQPERLELKEALGLLSQKQKLPYRTLLRDLKLDRDEFKRVTDEPSFDFPLWKLELKTPGERAIQQRYKMQLWVEAVDTDVDSEPLRDGKPQPHVSPSKDRFLLLVVGETELLTEIAKEEEDLRAKLEDVFSGANGIGENEAKLIRENSDLLSASAKPEVLGGMIGRLESMDQVLDKHLVRTREVAVDYGRILQELQYNQVDNTIITRVETTIVNPLSEIVNRRFDLTREKIDLFCKALAAARGGPPPAGFQAMLDEARKAGQSAREEMRLLKEALANVLDSMQKLTQINDLIKKLRAIEEAEQTQFELIKKVKDQIEKELLEGATTPQPKKP